ncbi:MAG: CHASE3 domain-containing protein [Verrucomicrobiota bacterium]|jgi:PAS domain S-box-containing protein
MKENIEKQVIGLFFSMLVILVGVAWLAVNSIQQSKDTSDWVNHTHEVILDADAATSSLHAGDASMYAFVLTGDRRDQENYRRAYGEMVIWLNAARDATRSDAYHKDFLALTNLIGQHINSTRRIVQAREQSGEAAARQLLQDTPDGSSTADIDRLVSLIKAHEENLLRQRDNEAWKQALNTTHVIEAGVVVNFALLLFASFLIRDDLKARRIAATAMAEANAQLEAKVQERTAELVKSNQFLKKENLERRWSYQALDHQFRYNQLIVNAISEMVFVVSKALNISRVNPSVTHVTQWEAQDLISQSIDRVLQIPADGPANPIISALNEGRELQERPAVVLTKAGATIPVRFNLVPLRDENKVVGGVVTVRPWLGPPQPPV